MKTKDQILGFSIFLIMLIVLTIPVVTYITKNSEPFSKEVPLYPNSTKPTTKEEYEIMRLHKRLIHLKYGYSIQDRRLDPKIQQEIDSIETKIKYLETK
jgi:hypothetical protein